MNGSRWGEGGGKERGWGGSGTRKKSPPEPLSARMSRTTRPGRARARAGVTCLLFTTRRNRERAAERRKLRGFRHVTPTPGAQSVCSATLIVQY